MSYVDHNYILNVGTAKNAVTISRHGYGKRPVGSLVYQRLLIITTQLDLWGRPSLEGDIFTPRVTCNLLDKVSGSEDPLSRALLNNIVNVATAAATYLLPATMVGHGARTILNAWEPDVHVNGEGLRAGE
ncbi:hypothetical protein FOPE_10852 [Fonsecaea pedrosoi]|nr:hypothetical protein FOPE_10852 [Fonsecaea pedrosoi]